MKQRTTNVYEFNELDSKAKAHARARYLEHFEFDDSAVLDDVRHVGTLLGVDFKQRSYRTVGGDIRYEPCIDYDIACGLAFEGDYAYPRHNVLKAVRKYAPKDAELKAIAAGLVEHQRHNKRGIKIRIETTVFYISHLTSKAMSFEDVSELPEDLYTLRVHEDVCNLLRRFADWIYTALCSEYEYQAGVEYIDDNLANGYEFDVKGNLI